MASLWQVQSDTPQQLAEVRLVAQAGRRGVNLEGRQKSAAPVALFQTVGRPLFFFQSAVEVFRQLAERRGRPQPITPSA
jgi:hypothetical protein